VPEIKINKLPYDDPAVQTLVLEALADLAERYGGGSGDDSPIAAAEFVPPTGAFFAAADGERLVGCAGWRRHGEDAELKRLYVTPTARGRGLARRILAAVEDSARTAGCARLILEMGDQQPEAIALYESAGYLRIEDFGFYKDYPDVLSYAKKL
jgi:GNAT superfamily N-acetyltransferase